jgi:putative addiction module component (TIGR02574 family)
MGEIRIDDIKALSVEERLELIERIWDTLTETPDQIPLPDWHRELLDERLREFEKAPDAGSPWEDVNRRITGRS